VPKPINSFVYFAIAPIMWSWASAVQLGLLRVNKKSTLCVTHISCGSSGALANLSANLAWHKNTLKGYLQVERRDMCGDESQIGPCSIISHCSTAASFMYDTKSQRQSHEPLHRLVAFRLVWMTVPFDIASTKQHAKEPHSLFNGTQSTVSSVRCHQDWSKSGRLVMG
jgi:hypothetical protein